MREEKIRQAFGEVFGYSPPEDARVVYAPGRVNLIGEHIDYNGGCVMPMAIPKRTAVLAVPSKNTQNRAFSEQFCELARWEDHNTSKIFLPVWARYVGGVLTQLSGRRFIRGCFDIYIASDVPIGVGLSSSAALETACAYAMLRHCSSEKYSHLEIAQLCMEAEHEYAGVRCGLMDQVASIFSRKDQVIVFDTLQNTIERHPFFKDCTIAIVDSGICRSLSDSRYNERRAECEQALEAISKHANAEKTESWRNISEAALDKLRGKIKASFFRRSLHVVSEMERVKKARHALVGADKGEFGRLMNESHYSLRDNFDVSTAELDFLQGIMADTPGVHGVRLTGAGFGGCVIALVGGAHKGILRNQVEVYEEKTGNKTTVMFAKPASGVAELLSL